MANDSTISQAKVDLIELRNRKKYISEQKHIEFDLIIWNYTAACQYDFAWDEYTRICRGLITDLEGNIVSRPFPKFHNLSEHLGDDSRLPSLNWKQNFYVTEKFDGSLGVLYPTPKGYKIATRGSFISEQSIKGTMLLSKLTQNFHPHYTYLFEIIYPENRIVVDYGDSEKLVLLDVVDTLTGKSVYNFERFAREINCDCVFDLKLEQKDMEALSGSNREGVVVRFDDGTRIKIKIEEYVRLHRLITGTNARSIWDILQHKGDLKDLLDRVPDEYYNWVKKTEEKIKNDYTSIVVQAVKDFAEAPDYFNRKEFAEYARKTKYPSLLFSLLSGKNYTDYVWKLIKPEHFVPFHQDVDA